VSARLPLAVVVDLNKTGAATARCLGRAGLRVTGAHGVGYPAIGARSRYVSAPHVQPGLAPTALLNVLRRFAGDTGDKAVIFCATDEAVDFCSRHRGALEDRFHLPAARSAALHELLDKGLQGTVAARGGLSVPPTIVVHQDDGANLAELADVPLPAIVKPANSLLGYKRFMGVESTRSGLEARVASTLPRCPHLVVSAYVPGDASANRTVMGLARRAGPPIGVMVTRKLRQVPRLAYGSASLAETCVDDELVDLAARFVRETGVTGPFELEFKREHGTGRAWFLEANFRFSALVGMTAAGDMNLPHLVYLDAIGAPVPEPPPEPPRVRWVDELRDWRLCASGEVSLDELLHGYADVNCPSLFDRDDPGPFEMALHEARREAGADRPLFDRVLEHLLTTWNSRPCGASAGVST
jgi:predicted ATP-grasp superfamily ATP-dependent carboligase